MSLHLIREIYVRYTCRLVIYVHLLNATIFYRMSFLYLFSPFVTIKGILDSKVIRINIIPNKLFKPWYEVFSITWIWKAMIIFNSKSSVNITNPQRCKTHVKFSSVHTVLFRMILFCTNQPFVRIMAYPILFKSGLKNIWIISFEIQLNILANMT